MSLEDGNMLWSMTLFYRFHVASLLNIEIGEVRTQINGVIKNLIVDSNIMTTNQTTSEIDEFITNNSWEHGNFIEPCIHF